jgi:hypothetical protein
LYKKITGGDGQPAEDNGITNRCLPECSLHAQMPGGFYAVEDETSIRPSNI